MSTIAILVFALVFLLAEEILGLSKDTAIFSIVVALLGAFLTAILPYAANFASSVKASLQCFSLIFLTRVTVAVVPALILPPSLLLVTLYGVVLVSCALYIMDKRLLPRSLGFHFPSGRAFFFQSSGGLIFGVIMGFMEFAILSSDMERYLLFQQITIPNFVLLMAVMFWFVALGEELLFRGLAQTALERDLKNPVLALSIVSATFAVMHLGYVTSPMKMLEIVYVYLAATVIGYGFMKSRSLLFPVIAHGVANTLLFGVLPYIV